MSNDDVCYATLANQVRLHAEFRDALMLKYPDVEDAVLTETLEGLTDLNEILAALIRSALDDEALVAALSTRLGEMKARLDRLSQRAKTKRSLVLNAMNKAELKRLIAAEFTVSVRTPAPTLEVIEAARIPQDYWKPQPAKLDRQRLIEELKAGAAIAGAQLGPRTSQLSVRVK
jgi:hypothetical protein